MEKNNTAQATGPPVGNTHLYRKGERKVVDAMAVRNLAKALASTAQKVETLANCVFNGNWGMYEDLILDELNHCQVLTLSLTSVFAGPPEQDTTTPMNDTGTRGEPM